MPREARFEDLIVGTFALLVALGLRRRARGRKREDRLLEFRCQPRLRLRISKPASSC